MLSLLDRFFPLTMVVGAYFGAIINTAVIVRKFRRDPTSVDDWYKSNNGRVDLLSSSFTGAYMGFFWPISIPCIVIRKVGERLKD